MRLALVALLLSPALLQCTADSSPTETKSGAVSDATTAPDTHVAPAPDTHVAPAPDALGEPDTLPTPAPPFEQLVPLAEVAEGLEVPPQTLLHLSARSLEALPPGFSRWSWAVEQPPGSASVFLPSDAVPDPTFEANVAGRYVFILTAYDGAGRAAPKQAKMVVHAVPTDALHIELLWDTPGDADPTNEGFNGFGESVGSDVDVHFLHPAAVGEGENPRRYFDPDYDCYWRHTNPNWAGLGDEHEPHLDRDDTDGAGPENVNLALPEDGLTYRVGVHYWDDWGYGTSFGTVRVYVHGALAYEHAGVQLLNDDLWEVADILWQGGTATIAPIEAGVAGSGVPLVHSGFFFGGWP